MSGFDKSPDYGGAEPTKKGFWIWLLCPLVLSALVAWAWLS